MDDARLTLIEAELTALNARTQSDRFLLDLIQYADSGMGLPVALLVNGMAIAGSLAPPDVLADHLDGNFRRLIKSAEKPTDVGHEEWQQKSEKASTRFSRALRGAKEEDAQLEKELDEFEDNSDDGEQLPRDLELGWIALNSRAHLTLKDAQIAAPGERMTKVPILRVNISQITAWWAPETNEQGEARFALFGDVSDES